MTDSAELHRRTRERGANPLVYWLIRAVLQPFFHLYWRLSRIGMHHIPDGPVIFASNHRSFLDPFVIAVLVRRPIYFVAKRELFKHPFVGWLLNSLGAFPVDRGRGDTDAIDTAKEIIARGDCVLIFPEGTRVRPGPIGDPKRGVGRLALETGAPVVPVAIIGTEAVRNGWRFRPHKVRIRVGAPLTFPRVPAASRQLAAAVTARIWPCVALQWEWLGGTPPLRTAAVVGDGERAVDLAVSFARGGLEVVREVQRADLVAFAADAHDLPAAVAAHGHLVRPSAGVLVASRGLVAPDGTRPTAFVAERVPARAHACVTGPAPAALTLGCADEVFLQQAADVFAHGGLDATVSDDVAGIELAAIARDAAAFAVLATAPAGSVAAGAAAGKVLAELAELAAATGGRAGTFAGVAGAGGLVAAILPSSRGPDPVDSETLRLAARAASAARVSTPALRALADVAEGTADAASLPARLATARRGRTVTTLREAA